MLGGGVQISKITEFCGAPGIGKTQIGFHFILLLFFFFRSELNSLKRQCL